MRRDERQPPQRTDLVQLPQQARLGDARAEVAAVGVDGLAQQGDLGNAVVAQALRLLDDDIDRAADLLTAGGRHDAIGARHVAASHHAHIRLRAMRADPDVAGDCVAADTIVDRDNA